MSNRISYAKYAPEITNTLFATNKAILAGSLEKKIIDLVNIRVSQINGCIFCLDMHSKEAKVHGERELRLYHLAVWRESPLFSEKERAALNWAEALTKIDPHEIDDQTYESTLRYFNEKELSELTIAVATINSWNRLGVAFQSTPGTLDKMFGLDKAGLS